MRSLAECSVLATEFLADLVRRLEGQNVTYALVGSIAAMSYGEPRATLDVDVVVAMDTAGIGALERIFPFPEYHFPLEAAKEAIRSRAQFNVIHPASGMKVDFFVAGDSIERSQIERRMRRALLPGVRAWCSPPEELVIKKLLYYRQGGSDKHLRDTASMLRISPGQIDLERVRGLAVENQVDDLLKRVLDVAGEG